MYIIELIKGMNQRFQDMSFLFRLNFIGLLIILPFLMQMYAWNIPKSQQLFECQSSTFASPSNKEKEFNEIEQCELLQKFLVLTDGQWL